MLSPSFPNPARRPLQSRCGAEPSPRPALLPAARCLASRRPVHRETRQPYQPDYGAIDLARDAAYLDLLPLENRDAPERKGLLHCLGKG